MKIIDFSTAEVISAATNVPITADLDYLWFLDTRGGTGRTFLIKTIQDFLEVQESGVIAVSTSEVATSLFHHC